MDSNPPDRQRVAFARRLVSTLLPLGLAEAGNDRLAEQALRISSLARHARAHAAFEILCQQESSTAPPPEARHGARDAVRERFEAMAAADRRHIMYWLIEAAFAHPRHGGNQDRECWQAIGYAPDG